MKAIKYLSILFFVFFAVTSSVEAKEIVLGVFTSGETGKINQEVKITVGENEYQLTPEEISKWIRESSRLGYNQNYSSEIENIDFCLYQKSIGCYLTFSSRLQNHIQKKSSVYLNEDLAIKYLKDLARNVNKDPEDAKLKIEDGKVSVFSLSNRGIKLDEEKSLEILKTFFKNESDGTSLSLPYDEIKPEISINSIDNMGITTLVGEGRSNFRGSPKNRIFNINVAAKRFNGVLIKPSEEFSFVKILGEVDGEHGYLPELVIKKDKTEPEFGGGICQVSTTAFRAAIYSGLEITARRNHAYPVGYYNPQGMGATVYVPRPDLRFINNTPNYILIQTKIEGTELIFNFYGTDDGRKTNVVGPTITERKPDGSMKATFTQQVYDKDGKLVREDVFNSAYDSPSKYPHPGEETKLTEKPNGWSDKEWKKYKRENGL